MGKATDRSVPAVIGRGNKGESAFDVEAVSEEILDRMSSGATLTSIVEKDPDGFPRVKGSFPAYSTITAWSNPKSPYHRPSFASDFARARLDQLAYWTEKTVDISMDAQYGYEEIMEYSEKNGKSYRRAKKDMLGRAALQIDTLMRAQARLRPDLYAERLQQPAQDASASSGEQRVVIEGGLPDDDALPPPVDDNPPASESI